MKKGFIKTAVVLCITAVMSLSACANPFKKKEEEQELPGYEIVKNAMNSYNKQNSGGFEAWNISEDRLEEKFVYWYDEVDMLTYYSEKYTEDGLYREYSTGYNLYVEEDGIGTLLPKTDERVIFYDKEVSVHDQTTDKVFYFMKDGIDVADVKENADGSGVIIYSYDVDEAHMNIEDGKLDSYKVEYYYNTDKVITHFVQTASGMYNNGEEYNLNCKITIIPSDEVGPIENPITVSPVEDEAVQPEE